MSGRAGRVETYVLHQGCGLLGCVDVNSWILT